MTPVVREAARARHGGEPMIGRALGGFVLRERIGRGGQALLYRADQPALAREAMVKVLDPRRRASDPAIARFLREAQLASSLDHPYAAHVYAAGAEPDGVLWIAMELVRGTPLDQLIRTHGPLPLERFVPLLERLCQVVHTAHEQGVIHRDIKPANVMVVARAGRLLPKLLDFGIATRAVNAELAANDETRGDAGVVGSPAYMAPEQWLDAECATAATDLYQLAVLSWEVLVGRRPFDGPTVAALVHAHATAPVPAVPPPLPPALDAVFARALAKAPADRYDSALAFAVAVRAAAGSSAAVALPQLDEPLRDALVRLAPQPIADAIAALEAARDARAAWNAIGDVIAVVSRWLGVVALCGRGRVSGPAGSGPLAPLARLRDDRLADHDWIALARDLCRPFADKREAFPVPELVELLVGDDGRDRDPFAALLAVRRAARADTGESDERLAEHVADATRELAAALRAIAFVQDYPLAVATGDGLELWTGAARAPRVRLPVVGPPLAEGTAVLLSADGVPVLELAPLAQVAPPSPNLPRELFLVDGGGRRGARLVAYPTRYERQDDRPWPWLVDRGLLVADASATARAVDDRPPWRGLATLGADHAALFVGREREVEAAINRLRAQPLLAVVGPSGAGKSSFIQAGVVPGLPPRWLAVTVRPGPSPWAALRARLARDGIDVGDGCDPDQLGRRLRDAGPIVLVVDQLEEIFTLCADATERARYAEALARTAAAADDDVRLIVTLRDDFLIRLAELPGFRDRLVGALQIVTTPARPDLLRILIEPARRSGFAFDDPALPGEMVDAVAQTPGALALLSFAATRLWELRDRQFRHLSRRAYESLGGVGGALARHAEATLAELTDGERRLAREAFRHLVTSAGTRAVLSRREILELLGDGPDGERVVERLVGARLLQASDGDADADRVEVIHEALLSAWPRLVQWRREDADGARLRDELRAAARRWHDRGRPRGLLWRDEALVEYKLWRARCPGALTGTEAGFAAASCADAERGRRRRRAGLAAGFAVLAAFAALQLVARREAQDQSARAEDRLVANYQEQARRLFLDDDPGRALAYAAEAHRLGARGPAIDYLLDRTMRGVAREDIALDAGGRVQSMAPTADGRRLVAASDDGTARIWDTAGRALATCGRHDQPVYRAELSPDGATLVTASWDGTARLWDGATCAPRARLIGHAGRVFWAGFSPDGSRVFTTGTDDTARIWDAATGAAVHTLDLGAPVYVAAFAPGGARFAASSVERGAARLWSMPDGAVIADLPTGPVQSLAFDASGQRLLLASTDRAVRIFDATTGALVHRLDHPQALSFATWDPTGALIASGDETGVVRLWDAATGRLIRHTPAHTGRVTSLAFAADGLRLASGGMDGRAVVWDVATATPLVRVHGHTDAISAVAFVDGDRRLATASWDHTVRIWNLDAPDAVSLAAGAGFARLDASGAVVAAGIGRDVELWDAATGARRCALTGHAGEVETAEVSPGAALVASGDATGAVRIWDARRCDLVHELRADRTRVRAVAFSPDGSRLVTAGDDGVARLWDPATGAPRGELPVGVPIARAGFSPDGRTVFVVPKGGYVTTAAASAAVLFDAASLARTAVLAHDRPVLRLEIAPDGRVLTLGLGGTVVLWRDGAVERRIEAPGGAWFDADLDPGHDRVVTCGQDPAAQIWDTRTGERVGTLSRHAGFVLSCAFSADGQYIVTASSDGTARIWDAATQLPLESLTLSATPDPTLWPEARFLPQRREVLTWTSEGEVRLWRLGGDAVDDTAIERATRCEPWRVDAGLLVPAADGPGC